MFPNGRVRTTVVEIRESISHTEKMKQENGDFENYVPSKESLDNSVGPAIDFEIPYRIRSWEDLGEIGKMLVHNYVIFR